MIKKIMMLSLLTTTVFAMKLKPLDVTGNGCEVKIKQDAALTGEGVYAIPLKINVEKNATTAFARKACQFSLPISLDKNEKVKITAIEQPVNFRLSKGTDARVELAVFFAGDSQKKKPFVFEEKATDQNFEQIKKFMSADQSFESACGKDVILRGLLSAYLKGSQGSVTSDLLNLNIKIEKCP